MAGVIQLLSGIFRPYGVTFGEKDGHQQVSTLLLPFHMYSCSVGTDPQRKRDTVQWFSVFFFSGDTAVTL